MAQSIYDLNTTDDSNSTIDNHDVAENNAPNTLNDALRAMAGMLARFIHSVTGEKVTAGTADAQTLTTGMGFTSAAEVPVAFTAGAGLTNTGAMTLAVDSIGTKSVKVSDGAGALSDPGAGMVSAGGVYLVSYDSTAGAWVLLNPSGIITASSTDTLTNKTLGAVTLSGAVTGGAQTVSDVFLDNYEEDAVALGSIGGGAQAIDASKPYTSGTVDTSETTFSFTGAPSSGNAGSFTLELTNGGSQTVNWPASVEWAGGTAPSLTASGVDMLTFVTRDAGTTWRGFSAGLDLQ